MENNIQVFGRKVSTDRCPAQFKQKSSPAESYRRYGWAATPWSKARIINQKLNNADATLSWADNKTILLFLLVSHSKIVQLSEITTNLSYNAL